MSSCFIMIISYILFCSWQIWCLFMLLLFFLFCCFQDRDKLQRHHLNDTVEELKRFNARRKLKGAVQAIASGVALDPLCCADSDSGKLLFVCGITIAINLIHKAFVRVCFIRLFFLFFCGIYLLTLLSFN